MRRVADDSHIAYYMARHAEYGTPVQAQYASPETVGRGLADNAIETPYCVAVLQVRRISASVDANGDVPVAGE